MFNATNNNVRNGQFNQNDAAAKEDQAHAQQDQATPAKRKARFSPFAHAKARHAETKKRRETVRQYVKGNTNNTTLGALALPSNAQQTQGASNVRGLHAVAHDVIKYTHTGLHAHAVKSSGAQSALNAVNEMLGLVKPFTTGNGKSSVLAHDQRRLTRHQGHLETKLDKARNKHADKAPEKAPEEAPAKAPGKGEALSSSSSSADKAPAKAPEKAPAKGEASSSSSSVDKAPAKAPAKAEALSSSSSVDKAPAKAPEKAPAKAEASSSSSAQAQEKAPAKAEK